MNWYVIYVKGNTEKKLTSFLNENGLLAFLPMMEKMYKRNGQYEKMIVPMFPNYLFVQSELEQKDFNLCLSNLRQLRSGIVKQLQYEEGISALLDEEKQFLELLMNDDYVIEHSIAIMEGDAILITEGPLKGMESQIKKIDRHKRMAYLDTELLGQSVRISLEVIKKI